MEFALAVDPAKPDGSIGRSWIEDGFLHYEYTRSKQAVAMDYSFAVLQGNNLTLAGGPSPQVSLIDQGSTEKATHRHPVPVANAQAGFLRLRVTKSN